MHTHDAWTLLIVDDGAVRYDLDRHEHGALPASVTLLPPHVAHDGRSARPGGFRQTSTPIGRRVPRRQRAGPVAGRARGRPAGVRRPRPAPARRPAAPRPGPPRRGAGGAEQARVHHRAARRAPRRPVRPADPRPGVGAPPARPARRAGHRGLGLDEAGRLLHAHPTHLVRAFRAEFGLPPHRYLTGRRVDLARHLVLEGMAPAAVATAAGFHDQAHLTRHFRRVTGTTPGRFVARPG
ncbi:AraC family transcriptional regulator [Actinomycetospora lutea]|uniref:AraC family transcriptional regulator n=1 Tax=Actinomycetospora lutea TaxID=663604 RepID=UPI003B6761CB